MINVLTLYTNQHEFFIISFFEPFVTCNVIKSAWVAKVNNISVTLRYFILTATYVAMCLKNNTFLYTSQKHFSSFIYWGKNVMKVGVYYRILFSSMFFEIYF